MSATPLELRRPEATVLADLIPAARGRTVVRDVAVVVGAACVVGALAQISIPWQPVPITGETFGVVLAGSALGWRRATAALALFLLAGVAGVPWFAGHAHGWPQYTAGYLVGFVLAAAICGRLAQSGGDRTVLRAVPTMLAGEACIYLCGVPWLKSAAHVPWSYAINHGFWVFVGPDAIKLGLASLLLPAAWKFAARVVPEAATGR